MVNGMSLRRRYYAHKLIRGMKRKFYKIYDRKVIERNSQARILVVLHLFYPDSWSEICEYLRNLDQYQWDLIVTYPSGKIDDSCLRQIRTFKQDVKLMEFDNCGYDVGPFIMALEHVELDDYDVLFKIQSKGVRRKRIFIYKQLFWGRDWFINLYEGILGAHEVHKTIDKVTSASGNLLVSADNLFVNDPIYKQHLVFKQLNRFGISLNSNYKFVAGTCFAASPDTFFKLKKLDLKLSDFENTPSTRGLTLAHAIERYMTAVPSYNFSGNKVCRIGRIIKVPLVRIYQRFSAENLLNKYKINDEFMFSELDNRLVLAREHQVRVGDLGVVSAINHKYERINETVPYKYLNGDKKAYQDYCDFHFKRNLPIMSQPRFNALIDSIKKNGFDYKRIIIVQDYNIIYDGQHRAAVLAFLNGLDSTATVLRIVILSRRQVLKRCLFFFMPKSMKIRFFEKRYGLKVRLTNGGK